MSLRREPEQLPRVGDSREKQGEGIEGACC